VYFPTTIRILDRLGLLEDTLAIAYLSKSFSFHLLASREVAHIADTFPPDSPYPYNAHFGQHLLAQLVLKHFSALPGTAMLWNTRLVGLSQDGSGATLTVETSGARENLRAQWVVGADGARSTVRNLLSLPFEGHTWPDRFVATNVSYDFERYGFAPANMLADAADWAVVARLGKENLYASRRSIPSFFPTLRRLTRSSPIRLTACTSVAHPHSEWAGRSLRAMRRTSATPAAGWA
jgi:2-polyprenyl-6-methoxyphenol hydroxylase-like FAD-dependent oxidoreductase